MFEFNYTFMNRVCSETDPGCDQNDEINTKREHIIHADWLYGSDMARIEIQIIIWKEKVQSFEMKWKK